MRNHRVTEQELVQIGQVSRGQYQLGIATAGNLGTATGNLPVEFRRTGHVNVSRFAHFEVVHMFRDAIVQQAVEAVEDVLRDVTQLGQTTGEHDVESSHEIRVAVVESETNHVPHTLNHTAKHSLGECSGIAGLGPGLCCDVLAESNDFHTRVLVELLEHVGNEQ